MNCKVIHNFLWRVAIITLSAQLIFISCSREKIKFTPSRDSLMIARLHLKQTNSTLFVTIPRNVRIKEYFKFIDSLVKVEGDLLNQNLSEYLIVHANPWLLDSLRNSDYYIQKKRGFFQYDQREKIILQRGDRLVMPDSDLIASINNKLRSTILDVNIPEYKLRIIQRDDTILTCHVRIGQSATKYLELAGREVNLQTPVGKGEIIRIERNPYYLNPVDGTHYDSTLRDDGRYTKMPIIPWLEPSINGIRYGTLIHATTNASTLGKAFSHGCVGTSESDAWSIYYNSPLGTKVIFRYDLKIKTKKGDTLMLKDIYRLSDVE
ncbi:MAG TPA: L,D-transpeptidase [Cytophagales bacterium]|jgi:hypothetical protein|nr:L,D-transpeptidase [Cytophagales bacterium]